MVDSAFVAMSCSAVECGAGRLPPLCVRSAGPGDGQSGRTVLESAESFRQVQIVVVVPVVFVVVAGVVVDA